ncbi:hypothetical protein J132_03858 [Termitomyces sp. J132]|nr:hypothetical protein J132_03858 [Termitomyces sp. J132]
MPALHHLTRNSMSPQKVLLYCNSHNIINIFNSLCPQLLYNPLLRFAADIMISGSNHVKVLHIPSKLNVCTELISKNELEEA